MIESSIAKEIQMAVLKKLKSRLTITLLAALTVCAGIAVAPHASAQMAPPAVRKHLYPDVSAAQHDIDAALIKAKRDHKRILLDFGGDWCGDCQVLDIYFSQAPNAALLEKNFVKVNINIGRMDANLDIAHKYGVPVKGVPALAVLDANGKVVMSQDHEFSSMRNMPSSAVTDFLNKWKR
jgi:thiol:disulfide interchange protein